MRTIIRWLLPAILVIAWIAAAGVGGPYFGKLSDVQTQDNTEFLPASAESTRVSQIQREFNETDAIPAIILYENTDGIDEVTAAQIARELEEISTIDGVTSVSPPIPSKDTNGNKPVAMQAFASIDGDIDETVDKIRDTTTLDGHGTTRYITGPAGFTADLVAAFGGIDGILLLVAISAVFLILLLVYRSPVLPILVLLSSIGALAASVLAVYGMAKQGWITLNGQTQGILFILVIGAATDYALLLVSRYREALHTEANAVTALRQAWKGAVEPIIASAGTVIVGLLCLLFSDLNSNKGLGPVAASGIAFALLASLTFLPAMLALVGRSAFFPFMPKADTDHKPEHGIWSKVARLIGRRPRATWLVTALILVAAASAAPMFKATGIPQSDFLLNKTEALTGQEKLAQNFPAGSGTPVIVIVSQDRADDVAAELEQHTNIDSVTVQTDDTSGRPNPDAPPATATIDGHTVVELRATLNIAPDSDAALDTVDQLRQRLSDIDADVLVGGDSATDLDTRNTAERDLRTIVPIVLIVIMFILMALLRSIIAPIILITTTAVSYLSTLGISALVFNHLFGFPGADPAVPLFGFVFLVALGIDYNIFLASRVREESLVHGTREGILRGLTTTGGVITSAGVVLAATFAALAVIPLLFLAQIAFIVGLGVLIDTLVVRSLLVPGILYDAGRVVWWPSKLAKAKK